MKFLTSIILIALLSIAACLYLPWWIIAVAAFIVSALIPQNPGKAFVTGFLALFFLWAGLSWYLSNNNDHLLAHKMSLLIFKMDNPYLLIAATGLVAALVGGFGALAGSYVRKPLVKM